MSDFTNPISKRQEEFSIAWLYAIASVAGYSVQQVRVDNDSVDAQILQKGDADDCPIVEQINIQLKCTFSHSPKKGQIHFPLPIKNYNDLREKKRRIPRILVVLHIPSKLGDWLKQEEDKLILRHHAYWTSLIDKPKKNNSKTVTIAVPIKQKFTVEELRKMMKLAANGKRPEELLS